MNTQEQDRQDTRLRASLTAAYPSAEPSDVLKRRVQEESVRQAEKATRRARRQRRVRLGLALGGVTALAILAVIAWPTLVAAQTLQRMESVMNDAQSAHITLWNVAQNGARAKFDETWYQAGEWRIEKSNPQTVQVFSNGRLWTYDPDAQEVRVERRAGPFAYNSSGFSLGSYMHDVARWGWRDKIRVIGETTINGRPAQQVIIDRDTERLLLLVDPRTDLPFSLESQRKTDHGFETGMVGDMEYNRPLPPALFAPSFPKAARIVDLDHGKQDWQERLAAGITSRRVGDRTIVIRDLQVNAQGDVFLLYTADKRPGDLTDWDIHITDEAGTQYLAHQDQFQPFTQFASAEGPTKPGMWQGYMFGGVKLEGNWWTPAIPQHPWTPHHLTLTFHVAPTNEHGGWTEMWRNARVGAVIGKPEPPHTETVTITQEVDRPGCALTPDYMPYMGWEGGGGLQDQDVLREDAQARLLDAWDQVATQADQAQNRQHDLPKALALYEQAITLETQIEQTVPGAHGVGTNTYAWFSLYQILRELGRTQEARDALVHSRDEAIRLRETVWVRPDKDTHWQQIEEALKIEGMR